MSKRYIFLAVLLIGSAFVLTQLPPRGFRAALKPEVMLIKIFDPARYLSTDLIAQKMIERDPSLFLIDVRNAEEFEAYSLPGAVNIPLENLLEDQWRDYLNQDGMDIVFFSNGDVYSDQAWMLCMEEGYSNLYVMKGGVNEWFRTIMLPVPPPETAPLTEFEKYTFRKGASQYFGGTPSAAPEEQKAAPKKKVEIRKKKKKEVEGGC